jgi:outer membrane protein assembly factor BamB/Spy/CpxP family protein refolding chaperone
VRRTSYAAPALFVLGLSAAAGGEWPQFRGPDGCAVSTDRQLPDRWGAGTNIGWKVKLPGYSWSSPVVWGDKVFVTSAAADKQQKPSGMLLLLVPPYLQAELKLTAEQKKPLEELQKVISETLRKVLTAEQMKQLEEGQREGAGGPRAHPMPGQVLSAFARDGLKLSADQKKQLDDLQKEVDARLDNILTAEQKKQMQGFKAMFEQLARGGTVSKPAPKPPPKPPENVYRFEVVCLDRASGRTLWKRTALERKPAIASFGDVYGNETPATDGERVYAYFGMHGLVCYDRDGNLVWKKDLEAHPMAFGFGTGSSPVLADGRLFVQCDNEEKSFLAAFDAKTGRDLWRVDRPGKSSWSTPLVWKTRQRTELVLCGDKGVISYDPATGKVLWEMGGITSSFTSSPVADAERVYFGGGGPMGDARLFAVKAGASGDITPKEDGTSGDAVVWVQPRSAPFVASPLVYQGQLYVLQGSSNILTCYDASTGKKVYRERLHGARGFTASPWANDGKVFCLDNDGNTYVVQAGPAFKLLGKNKLDELCWSSPAAGGGALYLRTVDYLYCVRQPAGEK